MSINFTQITSLIDRNCKSNSKSYPIDEKTADINIALDDVTDIILKSSGKWQFDDSNHTDYPIIKTDLIQNQRDYAFVADEQGNLILDIYKVMIANPTTGFYEEIYPVDQQSDEYTSGFWNEQNTTGTPTRYDKTANGIFLDAIPNYNMRLVEEGKSGIKIFINRESSYFLVSDTTKKPGFAGLFHKYLALRPSVEYLKRNSKFDLADRYERDLQKLELDIKQYYRDRSKDEVPVMTSECVNPY